MNGDRVEEFGVRSCLGRDADVSDHLGSMDSVRAWQVNSV